MSEQTYSFDAPHSLFDSLSLKKRVQMFQLFLHEFPPHSLDTVLDVGVTSDATYDSSNYFEKFFPHKNKIIALSNQNAAFLETQYPGLRFKQGEATHLPFADKSIDVVFSSAVIEHVGAVDNQRQMIAECVRVAKKGVFITTPNRWFPLELHTIIPILHWFPKKTHRKILKMLGLSFYAEEQNLNLLDIKTLRSMSMTLTITSVSFKKIYTFGLPSNIVMIIKCN